MLRLFAILFLAEITLADFDDFTLDSTFASSLSNTITEPGCDTLETDEDIKDCYKCYLCDNPYYVNKSLAKNVTVIRLIDNKCSVTKVCCFSDQESTYRNNDDCGNFNPDGYPPQPRNSLKSVLIGEYPWRAWVYNIANHELLCAATFVSEGSLALMTTASCVNKYKPESIRIRFDKTKLNYFKVKNIILHESFQTENRTNDIAILGLDNSTVLPEWVKTVCLPTNKPTFAIPCITVSKDDNYTNMIIPKQTKIVPGGIDMSFIGTTSRRGDYEPEDGGALICATEVLKKKIYYVAYGITLYQSLDSTITIHTNVTNYYNWIDDKINDLSSVYTL